MLQILFKVLIRLGGNIEKRLEFDVRLSVNNLLTYAFILLPPNMNIKIKICKIG